MRDICRPLSSRDVTDVSHAVGAVAARSLSKAQEFVDSFCPKGAAAQIDGLVDFAPKAYGDYKEMIADRVRPSALPDARRLEGRLHQLM